MSHFGSNHDHTDMTGKRYIGGGSNQGSEVTRNRCFISSVTWGLIIHRYEGQGLMSAQSYKYKGPYLVL